MLTALVALLFGGIHFVEQDLPGLEVWHADPLTGLDWANFRQADLDGDGFTDLVLGGEVLFQRDGGFPDRARTPLPEYEEAAWCDIWQGDLHLWFPEKLAVIYWDGQAWQKRLDQQLARPDAAGEGGSAILRPAEDDENRIQLGRFLHDLNGDGEPELVLAFKDGLHIYCRADGRYAEVVCHTIFPTPTLCDPWTAPIWPPEQRAIPLPARRSWCWFWVKGLELTLVTEEDLPRPELRYRTTRYKLDPGKAYAIMPEETRDEVSGPLPYYLRPRRLNGDDDVDFAGMDLVRAENLPFPTPIVETCATTDSGKTLQRKRTNAFYPRCCFLDFDGDGDSDMVTESTGLFDGGVRECISRVMTQRSVEHEVHVYLQNALGRFPEEPDVRTRFTIQLDTVPFREGEMMTRYWSGDLVDLTGDFNGDGYRDLVVRDRTKRLAIYLSRGYRVPRNPTMTLGLPEDADFAVADMNDDGRSDIVVGRFVGEKGARRRETRVHFAREDGP